MNLENQLNSEEAAGVPILDLGRQGAELREQIVAGLARVCASGAFVLGPEVVQLENGIADYCQVEHAVGCASGSDALLLALMALDIGPGDEVITSPLTYVATTNAILHAGASPRFVDVEASTGNLDAAQVAAAVTSRTRAILPVHLYGHMCDTRALRDIADRHGLFVVEDAAHCLEGQRDGVRPGGMADAACFSFYATKNITGGEGGAIVVRDPALAERVRRLRSQGVSRDAFARHDQGFAHYDVVEIGYKANLTDIQSALLRPQLARVEARLAQRERLCRRYERAFADLPGVRCLSVAPGTTSARHVFTLLVPAAFRDDLLRDLPSEGVGVAVNYRPVHLMGAYRERFGLRRGAFPVAEEIGARTVTLPLYPSLLRREQDRVIDAVRRRLAGRP